MCSCLDCPLTIQSVYLSLIMIYGMLCFESKANKPEAFFTEPFFGVALFVSILCVESVCMCEVEVE